MLKERTIAAKKGYSLLKRKSDAIKIKLQEVLSRIRDVKRAVGSGMADAAEAHNEAIWAAGDFNHTVIEHASEASFRVKAAVMNIAGVRIPRFERAEIVGNPENLLVGLSRGGEQIAACKDRYVSVLDAIVELATLQTSLVSLDSALKVTNRRVNALEFVVVPQLENTIRYVESELQEQEREDTYRVKKVKDMRAAQAEKEQEEEARILEELERNAPDDAQLGYKNLLAHDPDENIDELFS
jgi:V-type H+-transporting ATPase subunit D